MSAPLNPQDLLVAAIAEKEHAGREHAARRNGSIEAARIAIRAVHQAALDGSPICLRAVAEILALPWPTSTTPAGVPASALASPLPETTNKTTTETP